MQHAALKKYLDSQARLIDKALDNFLPQAKEPPAMLHEAMRYSALGPGKRIRPILTLAAGEMLGGSQKKALIPACAVEMIHSYSLAHDDLPCMDDDDLRRGRATCHKKFSEAFAILAGDGLLTEAFRLLGSFPDAKRAKRLVEVIADAVGSRGMVGGQAAEIIFEGRQLDQAACDLIHINKTGRLIAASCLAGAIAAGAPKPQERRLWRYGECIGLAFQIIDDIMDQDGYLKFMSPSEAREAASILTQKAQAELRPFGRKSAVLTAIADHLGRRVE
jgi:geranylgeranyl pyrophosphate synthase